MPIPQEQFLSDVKTQIKQYIYTSLETAFDPTIEFIQLISKIGPINWHLPDNQIRIQRVFIKLAECIGTYTMLSGDFRTFVLLHFTEILYSEFQSELFAAYVQSGYNVLPETVVGTLDSAPMLAPPQTTNFPGLENTSNTINPIKKHIVPSSIYTQD